MVYLRTLNPTNRYRDDAYDFMRHTIRQLDEIFPNARGGKNADAATSLSLRLDVKEDAQGYHVTADLPGQTEKDVEVTFDDNRLTIKGEKKVERDETKDTWHIVERTHGNFMRQLAMPANVDASKIEARFDKGVLSVTLPKLPAEQNASKKISIKTV